MATMMHKYVAAVPQYGVIGDRRRSVNHKKKHGVILDGVCFFVDVKYVIGRVLGKGTFGVVCSCFDLESKRYVAVKKIDSRVKAVMTLREMQILRQLRHPNVIPLYDVMLTPKSNPNVLGVDVYLVQQQMEYDLNNIINMVRIKPQDIKQILFKILCGVRFLHSARVIHRDLKPSNILVSSLFDVKIADFGHARTCNPDYTDSMSWNIGTQVYNAPELLIGMVDYGSPVDIWSVGCIFAEMLRGRRMFNGRNHLENMRQIMDVLGHKKADVGFVQSCYKRNHLEALLGLSPSESSLRLMFREAGPLAVDLLERMLEFNPWKRITANDALKHHYFAGMEEDHTTFPSKIPELRLEVDENAALLTQKRVWDLIKQEKMIFYHPNYSSYFIN